jgi:teichuronic acid biosynthesis glycosyltransferase TuaG
MGLWLKLLKNGEVAKGIQEPLAYYRIVKGSRSNNKLFAAKLRWETYRKVEKMSLPSSVYNFLLYMSSSLLKYSRF